MKIKKVDIFKGTYKNDVIQFWRFLWDPQKVLPMNLIRRERIIPTKNLKHFGIKKKIANFSGYLVSRRTSADNMPDARELTLKNPWFSNEFFVHKRSHSTFYNIYAKCQNGALIKVGEVYRFFLSTVHWFMMLFLVFYSVSYIIIYKKSETKNNNF